MRSDSRLELWAALFVMSGVAFFGLGVLAAMAYFEPAQPPPTPQVIPVGSIRGNGGAATDPTAPANQTQTPPTAGTLIPVTQLAWSTPLPPTREAAQTVPPPSGETPAPLLPETASRFVVGLSVEGREIVGYAFPAQAAAPPLPTRQGRQALVLVSGIHGDEMNAWPILQSLISNLRSQELTPPPGLGLYFIESLNPDGTFFDRRLNANKVDLNRNWETYDWRRGVEISPVDFLPLGGGEQPFSEPETRAMRDWLLDLQAQYPGGLTVLYFHAAVPPKGLVTPGVHFTNGRDLADAPSRELGQFLANATGYDYNNRWTGGYTVTGDASTWAVAQGMRSLTVELPVREALSESQALKLREGIAALIGFLGSS